MEWPELVREIKYAIPMERRRSREDGPSSAGGAAASKPLPRSGGKKSKGKKASETQTAASSKSSNHLDISSIIPEDWDWIDVLDDDSTIEWPKVPLPKSKVMFGSNDDETIRHTLTTTLKTLRLHITAYQLNCNDNENESMWEHGLVVWMRLSHLGDDLQNDAWLESLLSDTAKQHWAKRKLNENDEIAKKVQILRNIGRDNEAKSLVRDTLRQYPDDWEYWDLLFSIESEATAEAFLGEVMSKHPDLRGPRLVELKRKPSPHLIINYGDKFCEKAQCTHQDVLKFLKDLQNDDSLIAWSRQLTSAGLDSEGASQLDDSLRRRMLRKYIFGVKVQFTLLKEADNTSALIDWKTIAGQWKIYKDFESTLNLDQVSGCSEGDTSCTYVGFFRLKKKTAPQTNSYC